MTNCTRHVYDTAYRDMVGHRCLNQALEGDPEGLCGTHRAAADARSADRPMADATAEPEVTVRTRVTITLRWPAGVGPIVAPRYRSGRIRLRSLSVGSHGTAGATGVMVKKDGTDAVAVRSIDHLRREDVPASVIHAVEDAFEREGTVTEW